MIDRSEEDEVLERLLDNLNLEDGGKELLDGGWGGVKVTLIDYTLSRAKINDLVGPIAHFAFEDESLFEGKRMFSAFSHINVQEIISLRFIDRCVHWCRMRMVQHGNNINRLRMSFGFITLPINFCMPKNSLLQ